MKREDFKWKVCVRCYTFNHASYILDAMNGFTMQQTNFPYVCCIVDDASKDSEQEIISNYIDENFEYNQGDLYKRETEYGTVIFARNKVNKNCFFSVVLLKENHNGSPERKALKRSYISEWENKCVYEALCEGDDYWIDPLKLQKQVDFLDRNQDFVLICSCFDRFRQNTKEIIHTNEQGKELRFEDLVIHNEIATLTVLVKHDVLFEYSRFIKNAPVWPFGDYPTWLFASTKGRIMRSPDVTAIYRELIKSASHMTDDDAKLNWAYAEFSMIDYFDKKIGISTSLKKAAFFYRSHIFTPLALRTRDNVLTKRIKREYLTGRFFIAWFSFVFEEKFPGLFRSVFKITEAHFCLKAPIFYFKRKYE